MEKKEIVKIDPTWPKWLIVLGTMLNFVGIILFLVVFYQIRSNALSDTVISARIDNYLALVGYSSALGILTLVAGSAIILLLNPWVNFKQLMDGDGQSRLSGSIIFASIVISLALIIMAAN